MVYFFSADIFSSERGSINLSVPEREYWKPEKLVLASYNSLINLDAQRHLEMRLQQKAFFLPPDYIATLREKVERKVDGNIGTVPAFGTLQPSVLKVRRIGIARAFVFRIP